MPSGPKLDPSIAGESLADVQARAADEREVPVPDPPPGDDPGWMVSAERWPADAEPPFKPSQVGPAAAPLPDGWEPPTATLTLPFDEFPSERDPNPPRVPRQAGDIDPLMAEPTAYYWEETAEAHDQHHGPEQDDSPSRFPGRRSLYKRAEPEPSAEEQLSDIINFLRKLQGNFRQAEAEAAAPSPAALGPTLLQLRRLSRTGIAPDHFQVGVLPKVAALPPPKVGSGFNATVSRPPGKVLAPPSAVPVRLERRHAAWLVLTGLLCLVTLGLVGYLWTRVGLPGRDGVGPRDSAGHGTVSAAQESAVTDEALNLANLTMEAVQHGDFKKASDTLAQAQRQHVFLPGLYYQAALLAFNQGKPQEGDDYLTHSIEAHEAVSDCWYVRANTAFFAEGPASAAEAFEQAVCASPFSPRYYFFRAECLRRNGNTVAAVGQFQQALRCRPNSTDAELILFKIGLTKIESNTDIIFKTELHDRLSQEPVSGDNLLLATADAISRNEFAEAADFLKRAALALPPRVFQSRLRDYVFQAQSKRPEIAAVLKLTLPSGTPGQVSPRAGQTLIDPATRSLAEADPAGW